MVEWEALNCLDPEYRPYFYGDACDGGASCGHGFWGNATPRTSRAVAMVLNGGCQSHPDVDGGKTTRDLEADPRGPFCCFLGNGFTEG